MKDYAVKLAKEAATPTQSMNVVREYMQALILRTFHELEAFRSIAFVGGTALRFLYNLPRFSEDLDFSVIDGQTYDGRGWMTIVKRNLERMGFQVDVTWNDKKVVHTGWVRIAGLLHEAGISSQPGEKLSIKIEIDTHPPEGMTCEQRILTRHVTFFIRYGDLPSLFAGKLHASLTRQYVKGRDWYDFFWYRTQQPPVEPSIPFLQHALDQTQGTGKVDALNWQRLVKEKLRGLDFAKVLSDVQPFLERPEDAAFLTRDVLLSILK